MTKSEELKNKWQNDELTQENITEYLQDIPPEMPKDKDAHIAHNLYNLYQLITTGQRGTHWSKAMKEGRWLDAMMRSDLALLQGWRKIAHFLFHATPDGVSDGLQKGGIIEDEVKDVDNHFKDKEEKNQYLKHVLEEIESGSVPSDPESWKTAEGSS